MREQFITHSNNIKSYYNINGQLHREDGTAIEYPDGAKRWYINGQLHREDGPAVENINSQNFWYKNGVFIHMDN